MESMRDTYKVYRTYENQLKTPSGDSLITQPKSLQQACESFFSLFPQNIQTELKSQTDYDGFKRIIEEKNQIPIPIDYPNTPMNFDTPQEVADAIAKATANDEKKSQIYKPN